MLTRRPRTLVQAPPLPADIQGEPRARTQPPMLFPHEFLARLKDDPIEGCQQVCATTLGQLSTDTDHWTPADHRTLCEAFAIVSILVESGLLPIKLPTPEVRGRMADDCTALNQYLTQARRLSGELQTRQQLSDVKTEMRTAMVLNDGYRFNATELKRLRDLAFQLHSALSTPPATVEPLRKQLRDQLQALVASLRPVMPHLNIFWQLLGEARVLQGLDDGSTPQLLGWLGEMSDIVWHAQARMQGLPAAGHAPAMDFMQAPQPPAHSELTRRLA